MSGSQAACKECGNRHCVDDMYKTDYGFFCGECVQEMVRVADALRKIVFDGPEVQALVEAAESAHYMFAEQLRVLFGSFPDVDVSNENDIMIRLRAALAPFEVT